MRFFGWSQFINNRSYDHQPRKPLTKRRERATGLEALEDRRVLTSVPVISEFSAINESVLEDMDRDDPDWIELHNAGDSDMSLNRWYLTDDADNLQKWRFPNVALDAGDYLVVFASGKDRNTEGQELHTNFKLSGEGEYLALVEPDGATIGFEYAPNYPDQITDVSFGIPTGINPTTLIDSNAVARILIPTDSSLDPAEPEVVQGTWLDPDLDDSTWMAGKTGVGYVPPNEPVTLADSVADFSGLQNQNNWYYGVWNADGAYLQNAFNTLSPDVFDANNNLWDSSPNGGGAQITAEGGLPNSVNLGFFTITNWSLRRWVSETTGEVTISGTLNNADSVGDGVIGHIFVNGEEVYQQAVNGSSSDYSITVDVKVGDKVDFAINPGAARNVVGDATVFTSQIVGRPFVEIPQVEVANSSEDWSKVGLQGQNGWIYGVYEATADADNSYSGEEFQAFSGAAWTGRRYESPVSGVETEMSASNMYPHAQDGLVQWPIRRWESTLDGNLSVAWSVLKSSSDGDGAVARVFHNGVEVDLLEIDGSDRSQADRVVKILGVKRGDSIDLAMDPKGPGQAVANDNGDRLRGYMTIARLPNLADSITTNVRDAMLDVSSSAYLRIPFQVESMGQLDTIELNMRYDDGFVAYVNGQEVASSNSPDVIGFDSTASDIRSVENATLYESFDITDRRDIFRTGENVLQIHALNATANDEDLLIAPQLIIGTLSVHPEERRYFPLPSPGKPNGLGAEKLGPLVLDVEQSPAAPTAADPIVITATVAPTFDSLNSVELNYRVMFEDEISMAMVDDGTDADAQANDGIYTATIPGAVAESGQMIRWYVTAQDVNSVAGRLPLFSDPKLLEQYKGTVVDADSIETQLPTFHWFVENARRATSGGGSGALYYEGEFYDNVRFSGHGQSSSGFPKKSMNVDMPNDHRLLLRADLPRMEDFNFLSNYADKSKMRNTLGYEQRAATGGAHHLAFPVRLQHNGEFFAVYDFVEDPDERWLRRIGLNETGSLYKIYNTFNSPSSAEKKSRKYEDNQDLKDAIAGINQRAITDAVDFIYDNVNLAQMANYLAGFVLTSNVDCCHKNYYAYYDIEGTGEWWYLPWDVDLSNGRTWGGFGRAYFDDTMYSERGLLMGSNNSLITRLYNSTPGFKEMYFRRVRTLIDAYVKPPGTAREDLPLESRVDELVALMKPDADLDNEKNPADWGQIGFQTFDQAVQILLEEYAKPRREWLYNTQVKADTADIPVILSGEAGSVIGTYFVPKDGSLGKSWTAFDFDDSNWKSGPVGFGYENNPDDFADLIKTDTKADMTGSTSVYTRIPFQVEDPEALPGLSLRMKFDDGYVAYINGVEVTRQRLRQDEPTFDSTARSRSNRLAVEFDNANISEFLHLLRPGENILAIQSINSSATGNDMLMLPGLVGGALSSGEGQIPTAQIGNPKIDVGTIEFNPSSGNQAEEYIQLINNHKFAVDISGWHLAGNVEHTFDPGTVIPAGGSLYATPNAKAFRARSEGPSGGMRLFVQGNYQGQLPNLGGNLQIVAADGEVVNSATFTGESTSVQDNLRISEVMFNPLNASGAELALDNSLVADDFEYIELVNISETETLDLRGVHFNEGIVFTFNDATVTELAPGSRTLLVRNSNAFQIRYGKDLQEMIAGEFADNSGLRNNGEILTLVDSVDSTVNQFSYGVQTDQSWPSRADGRGSSIQVTDYHGNYNDGANWRASSEIHGSPGTAGIDPVDGLKINEVLSRPADPAVDQVELINPTGQPIDLKNYYLSDSSNSLDSLKLFALGTGSIEAGAYRVFDEPHFNPGNGENANDFALNGSEGDQLFLTFGDENGPTHFADSVQFGAAGLGESFGRTPNATGVLAPMLKTTMGTANSDPRVGPLVITEVNYQPATPSADALAAFDQITVDDLEFIEIHNPTSETVSLNNWRIRRGIDINFDDGTAIEAGQTLVVTSFNANRADNAARTAAFRAHYGIGENVTLLGGYAGQLRDLGEGIQLQRPDQPAPDDPTSISHLLEDELIYNDVAPWPTNAQGTGLTLTRTSINAFGNVPESWIATEASPGEIGDVPGDVTGDGIIDVADIDAVCVGRRTADLQFDVNGDGKLDEADTLMLVNDSLGTSVGDINLDGAFDSSDLVLIFQGAQFEDQLADNSNWTTGDWNCDGEFTSEDLTYALQKGEYRKQIEQAPVAAVAAAILNRNQNEFENVSTITNRGTQPIVRQTLNQERLGFAQHDAIFEADEREFQLAAEKNKEVADDLLNSLTDDTF